MAGSRPRLRNSAVPTYSRIVERVWMLLMSSSPTPTPSVATSATRNGLCTFTVSPDCPGEDVIAVTSGYAQVAHMAGIGTSRATFRCLSLV